MFAKRLIKPRTQFGPLEALPLQDGMVLPPDVFDVRVSGGMVVVVGGAV